MEQDTKIPSTCTITKKYCGSDIKNIFISIDDKNLCSIPISDDVSDKINRRFVNKIYDIIIKELTEWTKKK